MAAAAEVRLEASLEGDQAELVESRRGQL